MPPFFRYLNPPRISEVHENNMCAYFLHNLLLSSFARLIQTVMFNRYHDDRPKTYFTNRYHLPNYHALEPPLLQLST